jgi:hypothetical protein
MDISFNRLRTINAKAIPDRVQTLSLNDNLITRIDPLTFVNKQHLVRVDLYANQIVRLDLASLRLSSEPAVEDATAAAARPEFYLGGNPFLCDCNLEWLKTINTGGLGSPASAQPPTTLAAASNYPVVHDLESIYCRLMYSPENAYIPLVEARSPEFLCPYTAHCFALCHCCDFDACDCEMTCPDNCTCYHDQAWSTNIVKYRRSRDLNNVASKRCRENRKQRRIQLEQEAEKLQKKNAELKCRLRLLEARVRRVKTYFMTKLLPGGTIAEYEHTSLPTPSKGGGQHTAQSQAASYHSMVIDGPDFRPREGGDGRPTYGQPEASHGLPKPTHQQAKMPPAQGSDDAPLNLSKKRPTTL